MRGGRRTWKDMADIFPLLSSFIFPSSSHSPAAAKKEIFFPFSFLPWPPKRTRVFLSWLLPLLFSLLESDMYYRVPQMCTSNGFEKFEKATSSIRRGGNRPQSKTKYVRQKIGGIFSQTTSWWILEERRTENSFSFQPTANKAADSTTKTIICENDVRRLTYNKIACPSSFFSVFPLLPASLAFI